MKAVPAAARCCVIKWRLQVVLPEKPAKDALGFLKPKAFFRQPVYLKAGGDRCAGLHRLLIEARLIISFYKEPVGSDRHKDLLVVAMLLGNQPLERIHPNLDHSLVVASPPRQDERLRQPRIRIRKALFEPSPCRGLTALVNIKEPIRKCIACALNGSVSREPV